MNENQAVIEGVIAGALAWYVARQAEKYLIRTRGLRACQMFFCAVLLSVLGSLVLFFGAIVFAYPLLMNPAISDVWLLACAILMLWPLPAVYALAVTESRHRRARRR